MVAADANRASLYNYWGLGQAGSLSGTPYAFVGQGFDVAQGDYVDAKTTGSTLLSPSLNAYTEMGVGVNTPYVIMPTVVSYLSLAVAVDIGANGALASFLPQGWIAGPMGSNGFATASTTLPSATSVTSTFPNVGLLDVTTFQKPGYPLGGYPTFAVAAPGFAYSQLETWIDGTGSTLSAVGVGMPPFRSGPGVWAGISTNPPAWTWRWTG